MDATPGLRSLMQRIYGELPPGDIPWNIDTPPGQLVELVVSGRVRPCAAVDLGCGAGNYAVWLASRGFDVTGIDISETALAHGRRLCESASAGWAHEPVGTRDSRGTCRFMVADMVAAVPLRDRCFDFAFDWEVLHHIFPEDRPRYVANVHRLLRPGGTYYSVCFSETDPQLSAGGKYWRSPLDTVLYLSSESELRALFEPRFHLDSLAIIEVAGKRVPHLAVEALMTRLE